MEGTAEGGAAIPARVPRRTGSCSGTGTVIVVSSQRFCMIRWLPFWRTGTNPFCSRMRQISKPERTQSLPNRELNLSYEHFSVESARDFGWAGCFEEERERLNEVGAGFFNGCALAGDVEFRAERDETLVLAFDECCYSLRRLHDPSVRLSRPWALQEVRGRMRAACSRVDRGLRAYGKSAWPGGLRSPRDVEPPRHDPFAGSPTECVPCPRAAEHSQTAGDDAGVLPATSNDHEFRVGVRRKGAERLVTPVLQNQGDGLTQVREALFPRLALTIGTGDLRAVGNEPRTVRLNNCRELIAHLSIVRLWRRGPCHSGM